MQPPIVTKDIMKIANLFSLLSFAEQLKTSIPLRNKDNTEYVIAECKYQYPCMYTLEISSMPIFRTSPQSNIEVPKVEKI